MNTDELYIYQSGKAEGPYTLDQLFSLWQTQKINIETPYVEGSGSTDWKSLKDFEGVFRQRINATFRQPDAALPTASAEASPAYLGRPKSFVLYWLFAILGGAIGLHNFYARRYLSAAIQLLLSVFLWWTWIVPFMVHFYALVEMLFVRKDGDGRRMK